MKYKLRDILTKGLKVLRKNKRAIEIEQSEVPLKMNNLDHKK